MMNANQKLKMQGALTASTIAETMLKQSSNYKILQSGSI